LMVLAILCSALAAGCAAYALSCQPGEPSTDCCIKKFPLSPMENCNASLSEANKVLFAMAVAMTAQAGDHSPEDSDEFANNRDLPEWKQRCIKSYYECVNKSWKGDCYACIRRCEGQQDWPVRMCRPRGER
jgi:hypothetical protein